MPILKVVLATKADTDFPRDRMINVVHFNDRGVSTDENQICQDTATALNATWFVGGSQHEITATSYDAQGTQPVYPNGSYVLNPGATAKASTVPRDMALCLSYYADRNIARHRGRLYLPCALAMGSVSAKPDTTYITRALDLADALSGIGGIDVDWGVFSQRDNVFRKAQVAWVDNEWDTQRRRGLKATTRTTRNVSG
jgi:hypothetical protein